MTGRDRLIEIIESFKKDEGITYLTGKAREQFADSILADGWVRKDKSKFNNFNEKAYIEVEILADQKAVGNNCVVISMPCFEPGKSFSSIEINKKSIICDKKFVSNDLISKSSLLEKVRGMRRIVDKSNIIQRKYDRGYNHGISDIERLIK